jgi:hypothetical protein
MKYCLDYAPLINHNYKKVDEVLFFNIDDVRSYILSMKEKTTQRLILDVPFFKSDVFKDVVKLRKEGYNITIRTLLGENQSLIDYSTENVQFFFSDHCSSWDTLNAMVNAGVSDIYITDELGFSLDKVKKICGDKIQIRTYPNISQTDTYWTGLPFNTIYGFFISPNEIKFYEKYVDVCEFYSNSVDKQDVLYEIYKKGSWLGNLRDLILGLEEDLYASFLFPTFGIYRATCDKRCFKGEDCKLCHRAMDLTKELQKEGILLKLKEKEIDNNRED